MKETARLSISLAAVATIAAALLSYANQQTQAARDAAATRQKVAALKQVLPVFTNQPLEDSMVAEDGARQVTFYRARGDDGSLLAVAGEGLTSRGFGGNLRVLVGIAPDGKILATVVTAHQETPGLGTQVTDRKRQRTLKDVFGGGDRRDDTDALPPNAYLDQYGARDTARAPFKVAADGGDLDAVSGATISSRAVADAVTSVAKAFAAHRAEIAGQ